MAGLHWADYLIFAFFLLASLAIGVYHAFSGNKQRTTQEFIMADRNLKVLPTVLSLVVSFQSALLILGNPAEVYSYGTQQWFGSLIGFTIAVLIAERLLVPWIFPLKLTSVYEYLEMRYSSRSVRIVGAIFGISGALLYMGTAVYAPSLALEAATGLSIKVSIPIMTVVATAYTALGGMRAVIWTDVFQSGIMLCGIIAILFKGCMEVGGISEAFHYAQLEGRVFGFSTSVDPRERLTVWGFVFAWSSTWGFKYGLQQASTQRYSATGSLKKARLSMLLNLFCLAILACLSNLNGIVAVAYFAKEGCDPLLNGDIDSSNKILPYFVEIVFASNRGFMGLFLATLYSGALSSVSSSLSGCAANAWEDILKYYLADISEFRAAMINKLMVVVFGVIGAAVAFVAALMPGPVTQVVGSITGAANGPLYGMFILGGISASANWQGVLIGCGTGAAINIWIVFGSQSISAFSPKLPPLSSDNCPMFNGTFTTANMTNIDAPALHGVQNIYAVSFLWYTLIGFVITLSVGWVTSQVFNIVDHQNKKKVIDVRLRLPWKAMFTFATLPPSLDNDDKTSSDYEDVKTAPCEIGVMLAEDLRETEDI